MFGKQKQMGRWITIAVAMGLVWPSHVSAQKPPKPPKDDPITYTVVHLSGAAWVSPSLNQLDGVVEVVGALWDNSGETTIDRAHHWMVDPAGNVWSRDLSTLRPLDPEATVHSHAHDVNNHGVIIGMQWDTSNPEWRPLLWPNALSPPIELPLPEGTVGARATSINDAGIVVGCAYNPDTTTDLVAWKVSVVDGIVTGLVEEPLIILSAERVFPTVIANSGYVAVTLRIESLGDRAYRLRLQWDDEQVREVEGSRAQLFDVRSGVGGVNEEGTVCGFYNDGRSRAFVMNVAGDLIDLPTLPGGRLKGQEYEIRNATAYGLNNATRLQVVGTAVRVITNTGDIRGELDVLWNVGVGAVDITPNDSFQSPSDTLLYEINDAGWIVGLAVDAQDPTAPRHPVVLIPSR